MPKIGGELKRFLKMPVLCNAYIWLNNIVMDGGWFVIKNTAAQKYK